MNPLEQLLQQCTVKLSLPGQMGWGTGFFVAPGLILTCAHVVQRSPQHVQVEWQNQTLDAVVERTLPDPYDVALLRVTLPAEVNPPCVWLDEEVRSRDPLYLFGYPDEGDRQGEPRTFNCDGLTGSDIASILFNLGQVRPGMSGSPLLNQRTGKVCGIVKFTRDRSSDLGGGAIPTRVILEQFSELRELQQQFHEKDQRWSDLLVKPTQTEGMTQTNLGEHNYQIQTGGNNTNYIGENHIYNYAAPQPEASSSMGRIDVQSYLNSVVGTYEKWWELYRLTDVISARQATFTFEQIAQTEEPSKEDPTSKKTVLLPQLLQGIIDYAKSEPVLLVGSPGVGKSTTLLRLLAVLASQELQKSAPRIPVLIRLKDYQPSPPGSEDISGMLALIKEALEPKIILEISEIKAFLFQEKRLFLLLDGLNEIPADVVRSKLTNFREKCKQAKIPLICTARNLGDDFGIQRRVDLQPLSLEEIQRFLSECMPGREQQVLELLNKGNQELGKTPFVLWMLYDVSRNSSQIPGSLGEAFRQFTKSYTNYKINQEGIPHSLKELQYWSSSLEYLAFEMLKSPDPQDPSLIIAERQAAHVLTQFLSKNAIDRIQAQALLSDLLKYHLLQKSHKGEVSFCHQLIQEYYAAEHLLDQLRQHPEWLEKEDGQDYTHFQKEYLNYLKWTEPIALMLGLVNDEAIALNLIKQALNVDLKLAAKLIGALNQIFQKATIDWFMQQSLPDYPKIKSLGLTRSELAVSHLQGFLSQQEQNKQKIALESLQKIGGSHAISILVSTLSHDYSLDVRRTALDQLGKILDQNCIDALIQVLTSFDQEAELRSIAASLLQKVKKSEAKEEISLILSSILGDPTEDSNVRANAAWTLSIINGEDAVKYLYSASLDDTWEVNWIVNHKLGEIGGEQAEALLRIALQSNSSGVRINAAHGLSLIGTETAAADIIQAIKREIEKLESKSHRIPNFFQTDSYAGANSIRNMIEALGKTKSEEAFSYLYSLAIRTGPEIQRQSILSLGQSGGELAIPVLTKILSEKLYSDPFSIPQATAEALGFTQVKSVIPILEKLLDDDNLWVRTGAVAGLEKFHTKESISALIKALEDENPGVRNRTAMALDNIALDNNEDFLQAIQSLAECLKDTESSTRFHAAQALWRIGNTSEIVDLFIDMLEREESSQIRMAAVRGLGKAKTENMQEIIDVLFVALNDSDLGVRMCAAEALGDIDKPKVISTLQNLSMEIAEDYLDLAIASIQNRCQFYNYEIWQAHLAGQKSDTAASQSGSSPSTINQFPNVTEVKIFEQVDHYHAFPPQDPPS